MSYNPDTAAAWMNPKTPCDRECGCYWCVLWGFAGPVPPSWPTATNPAKVPEATEKKSPPVQHTAVNPSLFAEDYPL